MVGDTEYDMQMASHAGIDALGVSYGSHSEERLYNAQAKHVVSSFAEVIEWVSPKIIPAYGDGEVDDARF